MSKGYLIPYNGIVKSVHNQIQLTNLLEGEAKDHVVQVRIMDNMPQSMHKMCVKHNDAVESEKPSQQTENK